MKETKSIPVLLGESLPRQDRGEEERKQWCRAMLILFKPWRSAQDLKSGEQSWSDAFENYVFAPAMQLVINNMNVENECKDARDLKNEERRSGSVEDNVFEPFEYPAIDPDTDSLEVSLLNDSNL
ncbi:hypothetical protein BJ138DRAFT_979818, partial [Hygrophoropsis aurantiaca]